MVKVMPERIICRQCVVISSYFCIKRILWRKIAKLKIKKQLLEFVIMYKRRFRQFSIALHVGLSQSRFRKMGLNLGRIFCRAAVKVHLCDLA